MWVYKGKEFTSADIGNNIGFVYVVTNINNNKKYVGKKLFKFTRRKPPLKGKKRKRIVTIESDWMTYYGSNDTVNSLVEEFGPDLFHREILHLCKTKSEMSWLELLEQVDRRVLFDDNYYNNIIQVRINGNQLK